MRGGEIRVQSKTERIWDVKKNGRDSKRDERRKSKTERLGCQERTEERARGRDRRERRLQTETLGCQERTEEREQRESIAS